MFFFLAGVTLSRASVSFFPIKRVWILTSLQFVNFVLFAVEAKVHCRPLPCPLPAPTPGTSLRLHDQLVS